jgi:hypothetical protein
MFPKIAWKDGKQQMRCPCMHFFCPIMIRKTYSAKAFIRGRNGKIT